MKLTWVIEDSDVAAVKAFYREHENSEFIVHRRETNIEGDPPKFSRSDFWKAMVSCLLTTQQRAGPNSAVSRFSSARTFPLNLKRCREQHNLERFARETLGAFGGIRRNNRLADEIQHNFEYLESGGWDEVKDVVARLRRNRTQKAEIRAADFVDDNFKGFGPKQSRNLLQGLGLTRYEIPIDSRITRWWNDLRVSGRAIRRRPSGQEYYGLVSQGFRKLCDACRIYPCLLDAAIFSSYD